jgi:thiol-disulfide isomerase/thioredoxin
MKINKTIIILLLLVMGSIYIKAQERELQYPEVGKPCPNFTLQDVQHYSKSMLSVKDFKGQYVIFDFWSKTCMSCIKSFPHTNQIQKQFKDNLNMVLVGYADKENQIKPLYEKLQSKYQLQLIAAFDSTTMKRIIPPGQGVPHLIWVDKEGIIKAITSSDDLNEDNIKKFITKRDFDVEDRSFKGMQREKLAYNPDKPFLINDNGGTDTSFNYRTLLVEWKPGMSNPYAGGDIDFNIKAIHQASFTCIKMPLNVLYDFAYRGTCMTDFDYYARPILEVRDSSLFNFTTGGDAKNMYSYSLTIPYQNATKEKMMKVMQGDLTNYFGYNGKVEFREVPCLILTLLDKTKISELQKKQKRLLNWANGRVGIFQDIPIDDICRIIGHDLLNTPRIINETGLTGNINLKLGSVLSTDLISVNKALNLNGLDLRPAKRRLKY